MQRATPLPAQLTLLTATGGFLMTCAYLIPVILHPHFHNSSLAVRALLLLPLFILGLAVVLLSSKQLKRGIKRGSWTSSQITPLENFVHSRLWRAATVACMLIFVVSIFVDSTPAHHILFAGMPLWLTLNTFETSIRTPNTQPTETLSLVPSQPAPLQSTHWGER